MTREQDDFFEIPRIEEKQLQPLGSYDPNCVAVGAVKNEVLFTVYKRSGRHLQ